MLFNDAPSSVNLTLGEAKQIGASLSFIAAQSPQAKEAAVCAFAGADAHPRVVLPRPHVASPG